MALVLASSAAVWTEGAVQANSYPGYTPSNYIQNVDAGSFWNAGCATAQLINSGQRANNEIVVLDFGQPYLSGGQYGVYTWVPNIFLTTTDVLVLTENWTGGFVTCTGSSHVTLALGVNTDSKYVGTSTSSPFGTAWASLINAANTYIASVGQHAYINEIDAAIDVESQNTPSLWADDAALYSFAKAYGAGTSFKYYYFGDALGCSWSGYRTGVGGTCNASDFNASGKATLWFTQDDPWWLSWGAPPAYPLPQIYNNTMALEWMYISEYGKYVQGRQPVFSGAMTENAACNYKGISGCVTPPVGWGYLYNTLSSGPVPQTNINWSTDINWGF